MLHQRQTLSVTKVIALVAAAAAAAAETGEAFTRVNNSAIGTATPDQFISIIQIVSTA